MVGVLQYLKNPEWALEKCLTVARHGIFSYPPVTRVIQYDKMVAWRKNQGWLHHIDPEQYYSMVEDAGWIISNREIIGVTDAPVKDYLTVCNAK